MKRGRKVIARNALLLLLIGAITIMGACNMKVSSEKTASRADQIAYLKAHEQEMTDMLKRNHPKIESIQWQWDTVEVGTIGNGTPQGAGTMLTIEGKFNHIEDSNFKIGIKLENKVSLVNLEHILLMHDLTVEGGSRPYE